jgi:hypothetical protein
MVSREQGADLAKARAQKACERCRMYGPPDGELCGEFVHARFPCYANPHDVEIWTKGYWRVS